jgi:hypothetical protein
MPVGAKGDLPASVINPNLLKFDIGTGMNRKSCFNERDSYSSGCGSVYLMNF